jgi:hypothetical protein
MRLNMALATLIVKFATIVGLAIYALCEKLDWLWNQLLGVLVIFVVEQTRLKWVYADWMKLGESWNAARWRS